MVKPRKIACQTAQLKKKKMEEGFHIEIAKTQLSFGKECNSHCYGNLCCLETSRNKFIVICDNLCGMFFFSAFVDGPITMAEVILMFM